MSLRGCKSRWELHLGLGAFFFFAASYFEEGRAADAKLAGHERLDTPWNLAKKNNFNKKMSCVEILMWPMGTAIRDVSYIAFLFKPKLLLFFIFNQEKDSKDKCTFRWKSKIKFRPPFHHKPKSLTKLIIKTQFLRFGARCVTITYYILWNHHVRIHVVLADSLRVRPSLRRVDQLIDSQQRWCIVN